MRKLALGLVVLAACGDDGGSGTVDRTPHLVQEGDAEVNVFATLARGMGENNRISVSMRRGAAAVTDGTVRAGPLDAEIVLVYNANGEFYDGSFPGEHALVHVSASWPTGSADMVVALPAPITLSPDPPIPNADVTVQWQPWRADSEGSVNLQAGKSNSTLRYQGVETEPAGVTSLVVPSMYFPDAGSYFFDAAFDGTFDPTGGVGGTGTPHFQFVQYTHHLERTIL